MSKNDPEVTFSIDTSLLSKVENLARSLNISPGGLFVMALEDFIHKYENQQLLEAIDAACTAEPDSAEVQMLQKMRPSHKRLIEGEW